MRRWKRKILLIGTDTLVVCSSIVTAYWFRFVGNIPAHYQIQMLYGLLFSTAAILFCMSVFNLYSRAWEFASVGEVMSIFIAVTVGTAASVVLTIVVTGMSVPLSIVLRTYETNLLLMGGSRFVLRIAKDTYKKRKCGQRNALIIGAGACGTMIAKEMKLNRASRLYPAAFIDDDKQKHNTRVCGIPVVGGRESIPHMVEKYKAKDIIIAIPSASKKAISELINFCKQTDANLKIVPPIQDFIEGKISLKEMRDVNIEDLLGRDPIKTDLEEIAGYVSGKSVLVTGAGGSIGSELCRQIAPFQPSELLLLGHGENSIYTIEMELRQEYPLLNAVPIIADIQDRERLEDVFRTFSPQVVFHAAAHKHVPLMEANPAEAVKNNIFGTMNVAECAHEFKSEIFVLISTDKAVNPTSIMGTTKRVAEMIVQSLGAVSQTKFVAVRFGNVLGSRGSVIPRFKEQIAKGGPVTVTHPEMVRYFMTIPEAVQLVIQAGSFAKGGEIFILDMGQPVKIVQLAEDLIRLSGFKPYEDIDIQFTGIRPGEKLFEELLTDEEGIASTVHERIFIEKPVHINAKDLELNLQRLNQALRAGPYAVRTVLREIVPEYRGNRDEVEMALVK